MEIGDDDFSSMQVIGEVISEWRRLVDMHEDGVDFGDEVNGVSEVR